MSEHHNPGFDDEPMSPDASSASLSEGTYIDYDRIPPNKREILAPVESDDETPEGRFKNAIRFFWRMAAGLVGEEANQEVVDARDNLDQARDQARSLGVDVDRVESELNRQITASPLDEQNNKGH